MANPWNSRVFVLACGFSHSKFPNSSVSYTLVLNPFLVSGSLSHPVLMMSLYIYNFIQIIQEKKKYKKAIVSCLVYLGDVERFYMPPTTPIIT